MDPDPLNRSIATARRACWSFAVACLVPIAIVLAGISATVAYVALGLTVIAGVVAIILAGRPLRLRTGFDTDFMVSRVWLIGGFGLVPLMAPVLLFLGIWHLSKTAIGGYHTSKEDGGGRFIPRIQLSNGEGKPLGAVFLVLGTLWPASVAVTFLVG